MYGEGFFYQALIYLAAAVVSVPLAKRMGLGSVLGYLMAGIVIGPYVLGLVGEEGQDVLHFAEFGVVLMLFLIGLELEPSRIWRMRAPILGLGSLQVGVTTLVLTTIAVSLDVEWRMALAIGVTLALSSTAIVLQTLQEKKLMGTSGGRSAFSVLLFQDIAVIPILALLPLLATLEVSAAAAAVEGEGHAKTWVEGLPPWGEALAVVAAVALVVLGGRYLLQPIFRYIARAELRELFTAASLLLVIGTAMLMTKVGVSAALGTFLAGVVLARSEFRHQIEADIEPFKGLLLGLFFISVGAAIDFELIASRPVSIFELMVVLIVAKFAVLFLLGRVFKMGLDQNLMFAFSLAQGGEFAFVLFSFAVQHHVVEASLASMLIAVVALTMAATPVLMVLNERFVQPRFGTRETERRPADEIDETNPVIIAGYGSFGSIVGRLLLANGIGTTVLEIDSDRVDLLRNLGLKVFYGDASRADLLQAAGAEYAQLLVVAVEDRDKARRIVEIAGRDFPHLKLLVRAKNRREAYELIDMGVDEVFRDKLDSSLRMGVEALRLLGVRAYRAMRMAQKFRRHDELSVRELAALRHQKKDYINEARRRIADLERLLLGELDESGEERDAGWDTESLREEYGDETEISSREC